MRESSKILSPRFPDLRQKNFQILAKALHSIHLGEQRTEQVSGVSIIRMKRKVAALEKVDADL